MKTINPAIIGAVALSFATAIHAIAIEGLQIAVQNSNAVLSWPSTNGETYIVQCRQTLSPTDLWTTVTDYFPAAIGSNITFFVHSNAVQYPAGGSGSFNMMISGASISAQAQSLSLALMPVAVRTDGSGSPVPLCLYPPSLNMSGFTIIDPLSGESVTGVPLTAGALSLNTPAFDSPQPLDGGGSGSVPQPGTGFYRVVRDGVHIWGLTNGAVVSGQIQLPIEFAVGSTDQIVGVSFCDQNNSPIIGAAAQGAGNYWILNWDTSMLANGNYNLYAELEFSDDGPVISAPFEVTVSNIISFPNYFSQIYGGRMWIYAETVPNASYRIDMYGQQTNYLGYFYGSADGTGVISFLWGLGGLSDTSFSGVFSVTPPAQFSQQNSTKRNAFTNASPAFQSLVTNSYIPADGGGAAGVAFQIWKKEFAWSPGDGWAIAYAQMTANDIASAYYIDQIVVGGMNGEDGGVVTELGRYGLGVQMSPGNVSQSSAFEMKDANTRTQFLSYLADFKYRHCYFFGHGSPVAFGTTGAVITEDNLATNLLNFPLYHLFTPGTAHPYQFVFMDACDAGGGNMCEAFGIPAITVNNQYFKNFLIQSRAFLGFKTTISFNINAWESRSLNLGFFFADWIHGLPLSQCVNNAVNDVYQTGYHMSSSWAIYGATDLTQSTDTTQ